MGKMLAEWAKDVYKPMTEKKMVFYYDSLVSVCFGRGGNVLCLVLGIVIWSFSYSCSVTDRKMGRNPICAGFYVTTQ